MKVGVIGSGNVGQSLSMGFAKHGYEVMISSRDPKKLSEFQSKNANIEIGTFEEAAKFGEIIVLAVKGLVAKEALYSSGSQNLSGKIIIDATNPISDTPPVNGVLNFFTTLDNSLMEQLQSAFPSGNFVKAFNSIGSSHMIDPEFKEKPSMFICGNNDHAKKKVSEILEKFGFEVQDMGKAEAARAIEPLCMLWCIPGFLNNDWNHAFRLIKK